ncbi:Thaumatin-like protein 1 [Linum perenne]
MSFFLALFVSIFLVAGSSESATLNFTNNCDYTIWPGTLTGGGAQQLSTTGFELPSKAFSLLDVPPNWSSGRLWGRTGCSTDSAGKFTCLTADCGSGKVECAGAGAIPPATLVEFTLNGAGGLDFYDVSLVDGFNLPVGIAPIGGGCNSTSCSADVNGACSPELAVQGPDGKVVACKSACLALNKPEYCCSGEYGTPGKCPPTKYAKLFKDLCPQAYSYAYDDGTRLEDNKEPSMESTMLSSSLWFKLAFVFLILHGAKSTVITFTNNCPYTIWPGLLAGAGSPLSTTGFELATQITATVAIPPPFSGRFWARTDCFWNSTGQFNCPTGDCGTGQVSCEGSGGTPPVSLIEFTIAADPSASGKDFFDVSLVDGFNLPVSVSPLGGTGMNCTTTSCSGNVNAVCPAELAVRGDDGQVIACKSACDAFHLPQYCCTGIYSSPATCRPTSYSKIFKGQCPQAYSYAYDDTTSTFSCGGGANYDIVFCPLKA